MGRTVKGATGMDFEVIEGVRLAVLRRFRHVMTMNEGDC